MGDGNHADARPGFGDRLLAATVERGRLCAGIDPHPALLRAWGLPCDADGVERFSLTCAEAFGDLVAVVKPQVALFEEHGSRGIAVLERLLSELPEAGALTLADAKRGDIGSTMAAYARAWLADGSPLAADAVTVSPYLGFGSLEPALDLAEETGRGVFVLAATSNPEGPSVQRSRDDGGRTLAQSIVDAAAARNARALAAGSQAGPVGVVVGATVTGPPILDDLGGAVLMPGVGAQGAGAEDVARVAGAAGRLALPNISRAILAAGPDVRALRDAAERAAGEYPA